MYNYNVVTVPADQLKELQAKLIASQLREKKLLDYVTANCVVVRDDDILGRKQWQKELLSIPADTTEADALLVRVRELDQLKKNLTVDVFNLTGQLDDLRRIATRQESQLDSARAVIEEAESVLEQLATQTVEPRSASVASDAIAHIHEWKEAGK